MEWGTTAKHQKLRTADGASSWKNNGYNRGGHLQFFGKQGCTNRKLNGICNRGERRHWGPTDTYKQTVLQQGRSTQRTTTQERWRSLIRPSQQTIQDNVRGNDQKHTCKERVRSWWVGCEQRLSHTVLASILCDPLSANLLFKLNTTFPTEQEKSLHMSCLWHVRLASGRAVEEAQEGEKRSPKPLQQRHQPTKTHQ